MTTSTTRTMPARLDAAVPARVDRDHRRPASAGRPHPRGVHHRPHPRLLQRAAGPAARAPGRAARAPRPGRRADLPLRRPRRAGRGPLAGTGLANLHVLDGGITAWQAGRRAGQPGPGPLGPRAPGPPRRRLPRAHRRPGQHRSRPGLKWLAAAIGAGLTFAAAHQHLRHGHAAVQAALQPRRQHGPAHRHRRAHRRPQLLTDTAPGGPGAYAVEAFGRDYVRRGLELGAGQGRNSLAFLRAVTSNRLAGAGAGDVRPDPARPRGPAGRRG